MRYAVDDSVGYAFINFVDVSALAPYSPFPKSLTWQQPLDIIDVCAFDHVL